jgi:hypothetical protein
MAPTVGVLVQLPIGVRVVGPRSFRRKILTWRYNSVLDFYDRSVVILDVLPRSGAKSEIIIGRISASGLDSR